MAGMVMVVGGDTLGSFLAYLPYFAEVKQYRKLSSGRPFQCTSSIHVLTVHIGY